MARPKKKDCDKAVNIHITLDKNVYNNLKKRKIKISTYINQLLKVSLASSTDSNNPYAQSTDMRVPAPAGGFTHFSNFFGGRTFFSMNFK